ncbi:Hypothetical protein A7982_09392 [Minicystis rosea]|nr:Hypothetical protein A7982_09392 [Minicystis rosea]
MAWFYIVDGSFRFPTADGPKAFRDATAYTYGKTKVKVSQVLEWTSREALIDASAPPEWREAFFFDVTTEGPVVAFRGYIHRDEADAVLGLTRIAAELGAGGEVLLDHVLDAASGLRIKLAKGLTNVREGNVKMPRAIVDAVEQESKARARKLGKKQPAPQPKAKAPGTKTTSAKTKSSSAKASSAKTAKVTKAPSAKKTARKRG